MVSGGQSLVPCGLIAVSPLHPVLDSSLGKPAAGVRVRLQEYNPVGEAAAALEPLIEGWVATL